MTASAKHQQVFHCTTSQVERFQLRLLGFEHTPGTTEGARIHGANAAIQGHKHSDITTSEFINSQKYFLSQLIAEHHKS